MKKHLQSILIISILIGMICVAPQVKAEPVNADEYIWIYNQDPSGMWANKSLGSGRTLSRAGCGLYTIAHVIQWLSGDHRNTSNGGDLLDALISVNAYPWLGQLSDKYNSYIFSYGIKSAMAPEKNENAYVSFFDNGGVIIGNPPGHYDLAVGYTWHDVNGDGSDELLIHMIDSRMDASIWTYDDDKGVYIFRGYHAYDFWSFAQITGNARNWHYGGQYWMLYNDFKNFATSMAYMPKDGYTPPYAQSAVLPTAIELNTSSTVLFLSDSTYQLNATVVPFNANRQINWSSSNTNVATVSSSGLVTLKGIGTTIITAESPLDETVKAECFIEAKYNGTGSIQFTGIKYPHILKSGGSFWWYEGSGTISSDVNLSSITVKVYQNNGDNRYTIWSDINTKSVTMQEVDSDPHGIPMRQIETTGNCYLEIIATDVLGRTLSKGVIFESKTYGANDTNGSSEYVWSFTTNYNDPQYVDEVELNGTRYVRYRASYTWTEAKQYAQNIGGHLATISSAEENEAIYSLVREDNMYGAWIGAYRDGSAWKWVTDEPFSYTNWYSADGEPNNQWGIENYGAMRITEGRWRDSAYNNDNWCYFIVEFEPKNVESILLSGNSVVYVDDIFDVTATVLPSTARNKQVAFSTSNSTVVTIDSATGTATALAEGTCKIYATAQDGSGVIGEWTVTVLPKPIPPQSITIHQIEDGQNLCVGDTVVLSCTVYPLDAADKSVYFTTDNEQVAYIKDYTNELVCVGEGTCNIVAVAMADENVTDTLNIKVRVSPYDSSVRKLMETPDYLLSDDLLVIEAEAFYGIPAVRVKLSENVNTIGDLAFGGCTALEQIYIPRATTSISNSAFNGVITEKFAIVGYDDTEAQDYAERNQYTFISLDREPEISGWVLISAVPENAILVNTKIQYAYREKNVASYSAWTEWGPWLADEHTIVDSNLEQEDTATMQRWWAAKCLSCGHNNPYHQINCKLCGNYLGDVESQWISVFAFSNDTSGQQTILGRSVGRYFDGEPYWYDKEATGYRYRTRTLIYGWGDWSEWFDTSVEANEMREVQTRTMAQYLID